MRTMPLLTPEQVKAELAASVSEAEFTTQVIAFAKLHNWRVAHFRPAMRKDGTWRTAVSGDGVGFPDLVLIRGEVLLIAELKVKKNKPSPEQAKWLEAFRGAGIPATTWTPEMWPTIEAALRPM